MPTTIDRFFAVVQLCQNLSTMQNNMRANVVTIQQGKAAGTIATFADAQVAVRALGQAFLQRLAMNKAIYDAHPAEVAAGAAAVGIGVNDMANAHALLMQWATTLSTATVTNQTQLDNGVNAVLANVPAAMLPF
jgi:hypothetical protein